MNSKNIKARIRALLSKTTKNGCTEEEALLAAQKAEELLSRFDLSADDVEENPYIRRTHDGKRKQSLEDVLLLLVSDYCGCRCWISKPEWKRQIFGREQDVEVALYLKDLILNSIRLNVELHKKSAAWRSLPTRKHKNDSLRCFEAGMMKRIGERLKEMKISRSNDQAGGTAGGSELVILQKQNLEEALTRHLGRPLNLNKPRRRRQRLYNQAAFDSGSAAGERVSLGEGSGKNNQEEGF